MRGFSVVSLVNTRIEANVGGALRAAHCYDAKMIILEGKKFEQHAADTTKASRHIPIIHTLDMFSVVPVNCVPIAIEYIQNCQQLPTFKHPQNAMYIFGPENGSIPPRIIERCKDVVYIPTQFCMNLAATVNVVLYDRYIKQAFDIQVLEKAA